MRRLPPRGRADQSRQRQCRSGSAASHTRWAFVGFVLLSSLTLAAQRTPDFSGRWSLSLAPAPADQGVQSLKVDAADELLIEQSASSIKVQHPAKRGSHPKAATHQFNSQGIVGSAGRFEAHTFWFGTQLIIGTTYADVDAAGGQRVVESSETWSLDSADRLVIDIAETEPAFGRRTATVRYTRR